MAKSNKRKNTQDTRFKLNEPVQQIKNGTKRKSVTVSGRSFPARVQRDNINAVLLSHDFHAHPAYTLMEKDIPLLTQIASEGAMSGNIPALRYHAIGQLASFETAVVFNTLSDLAAHGEDHYIRSHAIQALGATGIEMAIPIIAQNSGDQEPSVQAASRNALAQLIRTLGTERVQVYFKRNPHLDGKLLISVLKWMQRPVVKGVTRTMAKI